MPKAFGFLTNKAAKDGKSLQGKNAVSNNLSFGIYHFECQYQMARAGQYISGVDIVAIEATVLAAWFTREGSSKQQSFMTAQSLPARHP